jgi:hypothetical protein
MTIRSRMQPAAATKTEAMIENPRPRQRSCRRAAAACLALCLIALGGAAARAQSVAFINPGKSDEIYWMTATQGMQAVARSLGMTFEVQYAQREPLKTFEIAREMVARAPGKRPDYIVVTDDYSVADQLLKIIDAAGVKNFSRLQLDTRRPARRRRIAARQVQRLARLAGAASRGRRRPDRGCPNRARQEGKGVRA